ncbi:MAG TPA: protein translocase subunit SecD [Candidatus Pacebacteria bacterium]|nr:protein translocase subunit SecD [Candidatus Paceibacterota bacterium]
MRQSAPRVLWLIVVLTLIALFIALPRQFELNLGYKTWRWQQSVTVPPLDFYFFGRHIYSEFPLKQGLDIQGGMQVLLQADMAQIPEADRQTALESAREVIARRVDLFGISEPTIQTSRAGEQYRLIVELPGINNTDQALQLLGKTAELEFKIQASDSAQAQATISAVAFLNQFESTGLSGQKLKKTSVQFDPQTGQPTIGLQFDDQGKQLFAKLTSENTGKIMAIFVDGFPVTMPRINEPILDGQAVISGAFTLPEAKQLVIQLNAGALPVPISVLEQRNVGASLGADSIQKSVRAGLVGLGLVAVFMILIYGFRGVVATVALLIYAALTIAIYKLMGVTLTLPGIAGLLLSIGMAVDANILIFERMKEELRAGESLHRAMELGFGRAWDSIKDANLTTILTSLVLINPLDFSFLNSSGLVRGFGITLLIGVLISLFTGIVVSRTLLRVFLPLVMRVSSQAGAQIAPKGLKS